MDNFMDKLAKRFNAGELIQANGEAEARENQRLKEQNAEYDKMMQEIRRLNLKTVEISEQVSQMIACGIEQMESYQKPEQQSVSDEEEQMQKMQDMMIENQSHQLSQVTDDLAELKSRLQALDELKEELVTLSVLKGNLAELDQKLIEISDTQKANIEEQKAEKEAEKQAQLEALNESEAEDAKAEDLKERTEELISQITGKNAEQISALNYKIENSETRLKTAVSDGTYRLEAAVSQLEDDISENKKALESSLANLERTITEKVTDSISETITDKLSEDDKDADQLNEVKQSLSDHAKAQQESAKQIKEMIVNIRLYMDEIQKHIEDYVHKEDVKVYRNVQAVLMEQMSTKSREMSDHLDHLEGEFKKAKGSKGLLVVAIIISLAAVALQVVQMLGIL